MKNTKSKYYQIQNKFLPVRQAGKIPNPKIGIWKLGFLPTGR
jgi:hypothetical protein